jgi:RNA 3'-phosphate cyclase
MCSAQVEGNKVGSRELTFKPSSVKHGEYDIDVGTAGSIPLVLQAGILAAAFADGEVTLKVTGGTDVRKAPSIDYFRFVTARMLSKVALSVSLEIKKRGYFPRGGGEVVAVIQPASLAPFKVEGPGRLLNIKGNVHVCALPQDILKRMKTTALAELKTYPAKASCDEETAEGVGEGTGITLYCETEYSILGASALGERGLRAENVGAVAGRELASELKAGASLDVHMADQLIPYMALGKGGSFTVKEVTGHQETVIWLMNLMTGATFKTEKKYGLLRVECAPAR